MSYPLARPVVVAILETAVPTTKEHGLGSKFKHDPTAGGDQPVSSARRFWLEAGAARRFGPAQAVANVVSYDVVLVVEYVNLGDRAALDAAIAADYEVLTRALADESKWQRATSTIRCIGADSQTAPDSPLFPRVVDVVVNGDGMVAGKRLRIFFQLEVLS